MKKRILCAVLAALMLFVALPISVLAQDLAELIGSLVDNTPQAMIVAQKTYYGDDPERFTVGETLYGQMAKPDASGVAYFDIKLDREPQEKGAVTVSYRTEDITAIAETGDYTAASGTVTLTPQNGYTATVAVQTAKTQFSSVTYSNESSPGDWLQDVYNARSFDLVLLQAEGDAVISSTAGRMRCALLSEYMLQVFTDHYLAYDEQWNGGTRNDYLIVANLDTRDNVLDNKDSLTQEVDYAFPIEWYNALVKTGMASPVMSMHTSIEENIWGDNARAYFTFYYHDAQGNKNPAFRLVFKGEFDLSNASALDCSVGFKTPFVWFFREKQFYDRLENDYWENNYSSFHSIEIYQKAADGSTEKVVIGRKESDLLDAIADGLVVSGSSSNLSVFVPDEVLTATGYSFEFSSDDGWDRAIFDGTVFLRLHDDTDPVLQTKNGVKSIYNNFETVRVGEKLRVMLRFSEPVRISKSAYFDGLVNSNEDFPIRFHYVAGSGTDTLCFEADFDANVRISSIKIESFSATVHDFSMDAEINLQGFWSQRVYHEWDWKADIGGVITGLNLDMRVPTVSVLKRPDSSGRYVKSLVVNLGIVVSGSSAVFRNPATLYYTWSDSTEQPEQYESSVRLDPAVKPNMDYDIVGEGNGTKYLHMKVVSSYGKESIADKSNSGGVYVPGTDAAYHCYGPYYFDNLPPVLPGAATAPQANANQRTYSFTLAEVQELSGLSDIALWYVTDTGAEKRLWGYGVTGADGPDKLIQCSIDNEDVGVGLDGKKERRDVTLFWVATDKVGNTHRTAWHTQNFDTNDYMYTHWVGPQGSAAGQECIYLNYTERIDGNTFLYAYGKNPNHLQNNGTYFELFFAPNYQQIDASLTSDNWSFYRFVITDSNGTVTTISADESGSGSNELFAVAYGNSADPHNAGAVAYEGLSLRFMHAPQNGYYDIYAVRCDENGNELITVTYRVYVTENEQDDTVNGEKLETGSLLTNEIYTLSTIYPHYYYMDQNKNVKTKCYCAAGTHKTQEERESCSVVPCFSSYEQAKLFVYYHELLDLHPLTLTETEAANLNSNVTGLVKALEDAGIEAKAGQTWLRYKSSMWLPGAKATEWVYYYYSDGPVEQISESALSGNLKGVISLVAATIAGLPEELKKSFGSAELGGHCFLSDASLLSSSVAHTALDKNGVPYIAPARIHSELELSTQTMCGTPFLAAVRYDGDTGIYDASVYEGEQVYTSIGNMPIPAGSRYQYKRELYGVWTDLEVIAAEGTSFAEVLPSHGIYYIRVLSADGVTTVNAYIDAVAPDIYISWANKDGVLTSTVVDIDHDRSFRAKTFTVTGFGASEKDRNAYIAVYKASAGTLYGIYTASDLASTPITLPDGNFSIVVADRSGNHYVLSVRVNVTDLDCEIKETENAHIKLLCKNREREQILRYRVTHNGVQLNVAFEKEVVFREGGIYSFYIEDIYGNIYEQTYNFKRDYPRVTWKYENASGGFVTYDENKGSGSFRLTENAPGQFAISSSTRLKFSFSEDYGYEFIGNDPDSFATTSISGDTTVTIGANENFLLKVYYSKHEEVYTLYSCTFDVKAPIISASFDIYQIEISELAELMEQVEGNPVGTVLTPSSFLYRTIEAGKKVRFISDGQTVQANLIRISASDTGGLDRITVYWNGTELYTRTAAEGFEDLFVSRNGSYRIVARDLLGNEAQMSFVNDGTSTFELLVDGELRSADVFDYIEALNAKTEYGNKSFVIRMHESLDVFYMITDQNGNKQPLILRVEGGKIYLRQYAVGVDENGEKKLVLETVSTLLESALTGEEVELPLSEEYAVRLYAVLGNDGSVSLILRAPEDRAAAYTAEARLITDRGDYYYVKGELSGKISELELTDENGVSIQAGTDGSEIRVNEFFKLHFNASDKILQVEVYFSKLNDLTPESVKGRESIFAPGASYDAEGFYLILVKNLYGNQTVYRVALSNSLAVTAEVEYLDGQQVFYSADYKGTICSNLFVTLEVHATEVGFEVWKNGVRVPNDALEVTEKNGVTYLLLRQEGSYEITVRDSYSNEFYLQAEIESGELVFNEALLYGYNEAAPGKSKGYTNQRLSISKAIFEREGLTYLAIEHNGRMSVLYDGISEPAYDENGVLPDRFVLSEAELQGALGANGDGTYVLHLRNKYGSLITKTIYYRETPTLVLKRQTRGDAAPVAVDIASVLKNGFWSNGLLLFESVAQEYSFTVNGAKTECPKALTFATAEEKGYFEYTVTYTDEYGFSFSFQAYLVRRELEVRPAAGVTGEYIDEVLTTRSPLAVLFSEEAVCTYSLNGGEAKPYTAGEQLYRDGLYRFVVSDPAGNVATLVLRRDTVVDFKLVDAESREAIVNGGVVNAGKVTLESPGKEKLRLAKVFLNGVLQPEYGENRFTADGKWELLLRDELGNEAYFCFHIVSEERNGFSYTTPYEYKVTEVWYDSGNGASISYLQFVSHTATDSSLSFTENGTYNIVMRSDVTGKTAQFSVTVNTAPSAAELVGCNEGEVTLNDVTLSGCGVGDVIRIYKKGKLGEELVRELEVLSASTQMPTVSEGGEYRIVVETEAGVQSEFKFERKHVMNTSGSVFVMIVVGVSVAALFTGLIYRNKSKTDE